MSDEAIFCRVEVAGRRFEVMLETSGKFEGMVHVYDVDKPKLGNADVVMSGARWDSKMKCLWMDDEDVFEDVAGLVDAVERVLFRRFAN